MSISIEQTAELAQAIVNEVERAVIGKRQVLEDMLAGFLSPGGHILLEDFPGLAKTLIAKSFAIALGMSFSRIQFTPDLLPGDITGGYVFDREQSRFVLRPGPVFANIILADEINRASPKTQSAMLEAMQEGQVTLEGETLPLSQPFVVVATQNPIEYEGTFPLPEAQLDRFIMKLAIGYPSMPEEAEILQRRMQRKSDAFDLQAVTDKQGLLAMRAAVEEVHVDPDLGDYIVDLVRRTRQHRGVAVGASPRGSLALLKLSRARAAIHGRSYVLPDDIKHFMTPALVHRLVLEPELWTVRRAAESIVHDVAGQTPVPVTK